MSARALSVAGLLATFAFVGDSLAAPPAKAPGNDSTLDACIRSSETGQVERARGHLRAAHAELSRCLAKQCPALITRDCNQFLAQVEAAMPSVVFRVLDAESGRDLMDAEVRVDGEVVMTRIDGRARPLDPGAHEVEVGASGYTSAKLRVMAEEGVKSRVIELRLARTTSERTSAIATPAPAVAPAVREDISSGPSTGTVIASAALAGVGVVALGTFAIVGLGADGELRDLRDTCGSRCAQNDVDALHTRYQIADVALAVGIGTLAGAALVFVLGPRRESEPRAARLLQPLRF